MQHYHQLAEYKGAEIQARYFMDGKRVSREKFEDTEQKAYMHGRVSCLSSRGKELKNGRIRRANFKTVQF